MTLIEALNLGFAKVVFSDEPLGGALPIKDIAPKCFFQITIKQSFIFVEKLIDILFDKSTKSSVFNKSDEE
jgi:hypothetical protein